MKFSGFPVIHGYETRILTASDSWLWEMDGPHRRSPLHLDDFAPNRVFRLRAFGLYSVTEFTEEERVLAIKFALWTGADGVLGSDPLALADLTTLAQTTTNPDNVVPWDLDVIAGIVSYGQRPYFGAGQNTFGHLSTAGGKITIGEQTFTFRPNDAVGFMPWGEPSLGIQVTGEELHGLFATNYIGLEKESR